MLPSTIPESEGPITGLADRINIEIGHAHRIKSGVERDKYFIEVVFPLLDQAQAAGFTVELNRTSGLYELRRVREEGEKGEWAWPEIRMRKTSRY